MTVEYALRNRVKMLGDHMKFRYDNLIIESSNDSSELDILVALGMNTK